MKIIKNIFSIVLLIMLNTILSYANITEDAIKQKQNFEKQKEQFQKLQKNSNQKIFFYDSKKPTLQENSDEQCIEIKIIKENSITLLLKNEKEKIFKKYVNGCRTLTELNNLTKELTRLYIDKGYVTSQVYFKAQKINEGILEVIAVEGKVDDITPNELYIENAFLAQEGKYLNLRDLERAIESINRLPSNNATMKIIPSQKVGTSNIQIENQTSNRINGTIGIDNYGSKKTGKFQGSLNFNLDNPLNINDQFSIYLNSTHRHTKEENSKGNGFVYSFPIGNRILNTISYKKTKYDQFLKVGITDYETKGKTNTASFDIKYKLYHDQQNRFNVGAFVSRYDTENFIAGSQIETSSYSVSTKGLNLDYLFQTQGFYSSLALSYTKGTNLFGTHNPTSLDEKFSLYTIDLSMMKQLLEVQYSLNGHYQHSNDPLFGNDQVSIGGAYSVRGYNKEGLSGNSGYYLRNELEKTLSTKLFNLIVQKYFIAYDYGYIDNSEDVEGGILASYSVGAKYSKDDISLQIYYAIPIRKQDVTQANKFFGLSLGYRF